MNWIGLSQQKWTHVQLWHGIVELLLVRRHTTNEHIVESYPTSQFSDLTRSHVDVTNAVTATSNQPPNKQVRIS